MSDDAWAAGRGAPSPADVERARELQGLLDRIQASSGSVWVVLLRNGILWAGLDEDHARRTAEAVNGVLARFPVVADYRRKDGKWGD